MRRTGSIDHVRVASRSWAHGLRHLFFYGVFAGVCAGASAASAQGASPEPATELSVDKVIQIVLANNPELKAARHSLDGARAAVTTASALANPRLEWQQGQWQPLAAARSQTKVITWSQPIENPVLRGARVDAAKSGLGSGVQMLAATHSDLVAQVRLKFFEALMHQAEAQSASEALALLEQVRERVRVRVATGEAARYEIIKADAEVITARERQQSAVLMTEQTMLELNRLAAGQLPSAWRLAGDLLDDQKNLELTRLQDLAQRWNPEVVGLQHQLERAQSLSKAAQAGRFPGLELSYSESREPGVRVNMWGVGMQIPLLDQRRGPVAEAQAELERSRTRLEGRQLELRQQVLLAWKALEKARIRVDALSQGVLRDAEAALRVAQAAYRFGERGILDVLDAQRVLRSVSSDLVQARFQLQAARIRLEQLSGQYAPEPQF